MKLRTLLVGAIAGLLLTACGGGSTPEDVTKSFVQALADGDCDKAKGMAIETAAESVEGTIEAGCESYDTEIKSVECETTDETASCKCTETRTGMDMTYVYNLTKVDGAWKVSEFNKDLDMEGMDLGGDVQ